jgi:hypothetical protein
MTGSYSQRAGHIAGARGGQNRGSGHDTSSHVTAGRGQAGYAGDGVTFVWNAITFQIADELVFNERGNEVLLIKYL